MVVTPLTSKFVEAMSKIEFAVIFKLSATLIVPVAVLTPDSLIDSCQ